ncbi:hypothetical protein PX554_23810 [Sphingomonas sp. H39-1-10]|uniref:hypothetical protein n=1 Tax=Sphingomonas pollutisoli TaxID=3030829 RepID=UPI0023BA2A12|nr:hypothetical protein [Sphingomonas pollutisoli]MDF0491154.1 hypothetical protein [Sphingomonas pollutisoli]
MNGIFSSTPGTGPIRLLVGTHGLLIAQSTLALMAPEIADSFRIMVALMLALALSGFAAAAFGFPADDDVPYWRRRRHVR